MNLGSIEINGYTDVVFYGKSHWKREVLSGNRIIWHRVGSEKIMPHRRMVEILQNALTDEKTGIWVEGFTINLKRLKKPKFVELIRVDDGRILAREPDGRYKMTQFVPLK